MTDDDDPLRLTDAAVDAFLSTAPPPDPARDARIRARFDARKKEPMMTLDIMKAAFDARRVANEGRDDDVIDNAALPAGSPLFFRCDACGCDIIVQEGFLTKPRVCYDCRDLQDAGG